MCIAVLPIQIAQSKIANDKAYTHTNNSIYQERTTEKCKNNTVLGGSKIFVILKYSSKNKAPSQSDKHILFVGDV